MRSSSATTPSSRTLQSKTSTLELYERRLQPVLDWLHRHLMHEADLQHLADLACFSPYHFHRIYTGVMAETLRNTQRRLRLHHAAVALMTSSHPVSSIAHRHGFASVQGFARAFRAAYGLPPAQYRSHVHHKHQLAEFSTARVCPAFTGKITMHTVTIARLEAKRLLALRHTGDYNTIGEKFEKLGLWAATHGVYQVKGPGEMPMFGLYYDDPQSVSIHALQSDACVTVNAAFSLPEDAGDLRIITSYAGPAARCEFTGPYAELTPVYQWLYSVWLPQSGREPADAPPMEEYLNSPHNTAPNDLRTAIYIPLK